MVGRRAESFGHEQNRIPELYRYITQDATKSDSDMFAIVFIAATKGGHDEGPEFGARQTTLNAV